MKAVIRRVLVIVCATGVMTAAFAQYGGGRRSGSRPRAGPVERGNVPNWSVDDSFSKEVFTFARIKYTSSGEERSSFAWWTDHPDADLNLSYRLQQLTSLKVNPEPKVIEIMDPELFQYPWIFMSGLGNIDLSDKEAETLRRYLLTGGFLMVDDFWGQDEWDGFHAAMKQVFPTREPEDLPRSHHIFHCVYDLPDSLSLQTTNIRNAVANRETGITWENHGRDSHDIHFRAILDDKKRIMVMICHNTDNGDGWEEEGTDPWFFSTFSEKRCYPLAINIIFYAMTH